MIDSIFKVCYFIGFISGSVIRAIYTRQHKQSRIKDNRVTVLERLLQAQLVANAANQGGAFTRNQRCISLYPASNVRCSLALGNRSSVVTTKLSRRFGRTGKFPSHIPASSKV